MSQLLYKHFFHLHHHVYCCVFISRKLSKIQVSVAVIIIFYINPPTKCLSSWLSVKSCYFLIVYCQSWWSFGDCTHYQRVSTHVPLITSSSHSTMSCHFQKATTVTENVNLTCNIATSSGAYAQLFEQMPPRSPLLPQSGVHETSIK